LGCGDWEANLNKKLIRPHLNQQMGHGGHAHDPSNKGSIGRRITGQGFPWAKSMQLYLKNKARKGWGHASSGRTPT
jgi:hypothetical protein